MRELRFEGLSADGSRLVLAGKDGQKWSVVIDERIEAAVRRDRARLGQVEIEQSGLLRPREIQARIRAGATAEDVAAASGLPLERIKRFEGPVLTERAYMAQQAGKVLLRRQAGDVTVAEQVTARLAEQGVEAPDINWDSWRNDDGMWTVIATFPYGPNTHAATWFYDANTRTMTAQDDNAEDLTAEAAPAKLRLVSARPTLAAVAPLAAQPAAGDAADLDLRDASDAQDGATEDLGATARGEESQDREESLSDPGPSSGFPTAEADDSPAEPPLPAEDQVSDSAHAADATAEVAQLPAPTPRSIHRTNPKRNASRHPSGTQLPARTAQAEEEPEDPAQEKPEPAPSDALFQTDPPAAAPKPKGGRSAVPSFDDILFGPAPKH